MKQKGCVVGGGADENVQVQQEQETKPKLKFSDGTPRDFNLCPPGLARFQRRFRKGLHFPKSS